MAKMLSTATPKGKGKAHKRNPLAHATILRKGGVHQLSAKAKRAADKRALKKETCGRNIRPYDLCEKAIQHFLCAYAVRPQPTP